MAANPKIFLRTPQRVFWMECGHRKKYCHRRRSWENYITRRGQTAFSRGCCGFPPASHHLETGEGTWSPVEIVVDSLGQAYDFFGAGGIDIHRGLIGIGSNPFADAYLPNGYPNKRPFPFANPPNRGHVILYRNEH